MKGSMRRIRDASAEALSPAFDELDSKLDLFLFQHHTHHSRVQLLISRAQGISSLVSDLNHFTRLRLPTLIAMQQIQNILDIRATESSKKTNTSMQELTEQSIQENKLVKTLTIQSTRDTRAMMVIALISAIFLPATFLAVS